MAYDINLTSWLSAVQWIKYQFSVVKYRIILIIYPAHLGMVRHLLRNGVLYRRLAGGLSIRIPQRICGLQSSCTDRILKFSGPKDRGKSIFCAFYILPVEIWT